MSEYQYWVKGDHLVLAFRSYDEEGGEWIDEENDTLTSLLPVRAELASGDLRALYIAWLGGAQAALPARSAGSPLHSRFSSLFTRALL